MKPWAFSTIAVLCAFSLAAAVIAQIDGSERGVAPLDSAGSFEVTGVDVDVAAKTAEAARLGGWRLAQRKGWAMLWAKMHGGSGGAPALGDDALDSIVAGIVVENEQIGPTRYVAKLGVLFDRARAGAILGVTGEVSRSAPMLVIPVLWSGGAAQSFEARNEWQKAWARYRTGSSPIDYVRPSGSGPDPLLLNMGQTQRPGRTWWRLLLDQYGAADVLVPQVRLERLWPGGPVIGHFVARHGPDNAVLSGFTLRVDTADKLPAMLDEGVRRIDQLYSDALAMGMLRPDPSLIEQTPVDAGALTENAMETDTSLLAPENAVAPAAGATDVTLQFETPDVGSVSTAENTVRAVPGVRSAATTSLALGGISVMRVNFAGDIAGLKVLLEGRGYRVEEGAGVLRIRRSAPSPGAAMPLPGATPPTSPRQ